jgi:hypothetical protein
MAVAQTPNDEGYTGKPLRRREDARFVRGQDSH